MKKFETKKFILFKFSMDFVFLSMDADVIPALLDDAALGSFFLLCVFNLLFMNVYKKLESSSKIEERKKVSSIFQCLYHVNILFQITVQFLIKNIIIKNIMQFNYSHN